MFIVLLKFSANKAKAAQFMDPFVAEDVVTAEIVELAPSRADDRLSFLLPRASQ